jgi:SAM-dependent methyltransferase
VAGPDDELRSIFASVFAQPPSAVHARVWAAAFGDEYPAEVQPYSYVTRSELGRLVAALQVSSGSTLVDVGCGHGGPGLWVCAHTGADLVGVDISEPALTASRARAADLGLAARTSFRLGDFEHLPLDDGAADGVMSVDAMLFAPDKQAAAHELARVLRLDGLLAFTSWDYSSQPDNRPPQVSDHRPILEAAGFEVIEYEETDRWLQRQRAVDAGLLAAVDELAAESGSDVAEVREGILDMQRTEDHMLRRIFVVAQLRSLRD